MINFPIIRLFQQNLLKIFVICLLFFYWCPSTHARHLKEQDAGEVISFTLMDADANVPLFPLLNDHTINLAKLPTNKLNIRADVMPMEVGSVVLELNGNKRTENVAPYATQGDNNGDFNTWTPSVGTYHLTATPYSLPNGKGSAGTALSVTFHIINDPSRPELVVENYFDATSTYRFLLAPNEEDKFFFTMKASDEGTLPTPAAITAIDDDTHEMPTWVSFASAANQDTGYDFFVNSTGLFPGIYSATVIFGPVEGYDMEVVKVILEVGASPVPFLSFTPDPLHFTFEQNAGEGQSSEYTIISSDGNASGDAQVLGIDVATGRPADWLSFSSSTSFEVPYTFYISTDMPAGTYYADLYGKAFSSTNYKDARITLELELTPAFKIAQFVLINANEDKPLFPLFEGSTFIPSPHWNIQVRTYPEVTGSVKIVVNGKAIVENVFPYAAFKDNNGDYYPWNATPGSYNIKATPYTMQNAKGIAGESLSINFTVLDNGTARIESASSDLIEKTVKLTTYPNPLTDEAVLEIMLPHTEKVTVELLDKTMMPIKIFEGNVDAQTLTRIPIDANRLQNGIYYTRIIAGKDLITKKLIVNK